MAVTAKVRCIANSVTQWQATLTEEQLASSEETRIVRFTPVYDSDPESPNYSWSKYTPAGYIELAVTNADAFDQFVPNGEYLLTFTPT